MKANEIILEFMVKDVAETIRFYQEALTFELVASEAGASQMLYWAKMKFSNYYISFKEEQRLKRESSFMVGREVGGSIALCFVVDDLEGIHRDIQSKFKTLDHPHLTPCGAT